MCCNPSGPPCHWDSHHNPATICGTAALCQPGEQPHCAFTQLKIGFFIPKSQRPCTKGSGNAAVPGVSSSPLCWVGKYIMDRQEFRLGCGKVLGILEKGRKKGRK